MLTQDNYNLLISDIKAISCKRQDPSILVTFQRSQKEKLQVVGMTAATRTNDSCPHGSIDNQQLLVQTVIDVLTSQVGTNLDIVESLNSLLFLNFIKCFISLSAEAQQINIQDALEEQDLSMQAREYWKNETLLYFLENLISLKLYLFSCVGKTGACFHYGDGGDS